MHALLAQGLALQRRLAGTAAAPWLAPVAVALLALALRLHGLGDKPFWLDEVATLRRAALPLPNAVADSLHGNHYPTYFLLIWLVAKIGASQWLLRLPSAVFGAACAGLVCAIGREADAPRSGIAAGLLLALSPFDVQYGQEARSYALAGGLILIALWGLVRLARQPGSAPAIAWVGYAGGTAAALQVLNVALPWFVAANLAAIAIACQAGEGRAGFLRKWGLAQGLILAAWLPSLAVVYIASRGSLLHASGWAPRPSWASIWATLAPVYLHRISAFITFDLRPQRVPGLSAVIALLAAHGAWRLRRNPAVLAAIGGAAVMAPALLLVVSLKTSVLVPRYFGWSAAPFFVLAGAGLGRLRDWRFAGSAAAVAIACLLNLLPYYKEETKPRWDLAAEQLAAEAQPGDVVLLHSWYAYYVLSAFADRRSLADRRLKLTWEPAEAARRGPGQALWVVFGRVGQVAIPSPRDYANSLSWLGRPATEEHIGRHIVIWRFAASDTLTAECPQASGCVAPNPAAAKP